MFRLRNRVPYSTVIDGGPGGTSTDVPHGFNVLEPSHPDNPWTTGRNAEIAPLLIGGASGAESDGQKLTQAEATLAGNSKRGAHTYAWDARQALGLDSGGVGSPPPQPIPDPEHTSDEPYESEHTVSAKLTPGYVRNLVYALENHRSGVNKLLDVAAATGIELDEDALEQSKADALAIYHQRLKPCYDAIDWSSGNRTTEAQAFLTLLGAAAKLEATAAYGELKEAHEAVFTARFPQTLAGFRAYRNSSTGLYKTIWKARRSLHEAATGSMLVGTDDYQDFIDFRDQDELRHLVSGSGGLHLAGQRETFEQAVNG